ncbi:hypothetical protein [Nostoc sp.]
MSLFQEIARSLVGSNATGHLGQELKELKHLGKNDCITTGAIAIIFSYW